MSDLRIVHVFVEELGIDEDID